MFTTVHVCVNREHVCMRCAYGLRLQGINVITFASVQVKAVRPGKSTITGQITDLVSQFWLVHGLQTLWVRTLIG